MSSLPRLPKTFALGSGRKLWRVRTLVLPGEQLHRVYQGECPRCAAILDRCPECDHHPIVMDRAEVEGFWDERAKAIYINGDAPPELQWWTHRHEAWHATIDWYSAAFRV